MSIEIMNAVWRHSKADGRARLVLLAIADHQGEMGAWPSLATLAKMVNASDRSVQRDIDYLQQIGELEVHYQQAPVRNHYKSNLYFVRLPGVTDYESGVTNTESGVTNTQSGVTAGVVQSLNRTITEPLTETHERELFDEFWKEYPKKSDKRVALKAFKSAMRRAPFDQILAGVIAYRQATEAIEQRFVKNPATWLNADAWENEIQPSPDSEAAERAKQRREREIERSNQYLAEIRERESQSAAPKPCQHGKNLALCVPCSKSLG
jgi:hypothetical protein